MNCTIRFHNPISKLTDISSGGDSSSGHSIHRGNSSPEPSSVQSMSDKETANDTLMLNESRNNSELAMVSGECSSNLEIASSPFGEVKIYLSYNTASGRPDFHMPSVEAVLKSVENKCLRSPKASNPYIPMMKLMNEICQCFQKLVTESNSQSPEAFNVTPTIDSVSKHSEANALGAKDLPSSSSNGSIDCRSGTRVTRSSTKLPQSKTAVPAAPCNSINDGPNKLNAGDEIVTNTKNTENCAEEANGLSSAVVQPPQVTPEIMRSLQDVADIAKGQEKVIITLVNEVNDETPPTFHYIPQNAAFQNAYVNSSLARIGDDNCCATCIGDCLSLSSPCACSHETGGEFAYTTDGLVREELLKECISMNRDPKKHCQYFCQECPLERSKSEDIIEPCKGHLVRKFIKECWWKCGCHKQCGNRVVQRGISRKLQVVLHS